MQWLGHQPVVGQEEADQRRLGGQFFKKIYEQEQSAGVR